MYQEIKTMIKEIVKKNRTYRRFDNSVQITREEILDWIDCARYCASAKNAQPMKYIVVTERNECAELYPSLKWAGYLTEWDGPIPEERPTAYILQLLDTSISTNPLCDDGLQLQAITMAAVEDGFGACIFKSFNNATLRTQFNLPEHLQIQYVVALGKPVEEVVIEPISGEDYKYWRTEDQKHHVPKRPLTEIVLP